MKVVSTMEIKCFSILAVISLATVVNVVCSKNTSDTAGYLDGVVLEKAAPIKTDGEHIRWEFCFEKLEHAAMLTLGAGEYGFRG